MKVLIIIWTSLTSTQEWAGLDPGGVKAICPSAPVGLLLFF